MKVSPVNNQESSTQTVSKAISRVGSLMGHAYKLVASLKTQNGVRHQNFPNPIQGVYDKAHFKLNEIHQKHNESIRKNPTEALNSNGIKNLSKRVKSIQNEIAKVVSQAQIEALVEASGALEKNVKSKVATLAQGGLSAGFIRLVACIPKINTCFHRAVEAYKEGMEYLDKASKQVVPQPTNEVDQDRYQEFEAFQAGKSQLKRRAGVIGIDGTYRIQAAFSQDTVKKQLDSFIAQSLCDIERKTISKEVSIAVNGEKQTITSHLIPLNSSFDSYLKAPKAIFGKIFGNKGISAANRQEPHLINGWMSTLTKKNGGIFFRAFRHGILADKNESNLEIRAANSKKAAQELLQTALLQEIADRGLTIEQAAKQTIELNLNSVSLVTPDSLRSIGSGGADEKTMLADQIRALKSFEGKDQKLIIKTADGQEVTIPVQVQVNTFNFGVNAGAVGKLKFAPGLTFGLEVQYEENKKALEGLEKQFKKLNIPAKIRSVPGQDASAVRNQLYKKLGEAQSLMQDIRTLMNDKKAYLDGDNQYEIGAKIIVLTNLMDIIFKHTGRPGIHVAFNCMSGKDRSGIMDAMGKAFASYAKSHKGHYPTHEELKTQKVQKELSDILIPLLLESGNLEITEINTGAMGYKVESEAKLLGMPLEVFLNVQGLSATTSA